MFSSHSTTNTVLADVETSQGSLARSTTRGVGSALLSLIVVLIALLGGSSSRGADPGDLLAVMTTTGIEVVPDHPVPLDHPIDLLATEHPDRESLAGSFGWRRFSRNSVVAPVWIDLDYLHDAEGQRIGHSLRFRFIVHVGLDQLRDRDLMTNLFGGDDLPTNASNDEGRFEHLSTDQMIAANVTPRTDAKYAHVVIPLMNQVIIRGVLEAQSTNDDDRVVMAWRLVDSIDATSRYAANWSAIERNDVGKKVVGPSQTYQGAGGFISVQSLASIDRELAGACLVEGQVVLHEPVDWFGGSNFLRSKFPLLLQELTRKFRRGLK